MQPLCICGQIMTFPQGVNKSHCKTEGCGVPWEREPDGYWAEGLTKRIFTPILKRKLNHYQKYMRWRDSLSRTPKSQRGSKRTGDKSDGV